VLDPADGQDDLFLVYLHLDAVAPGVAQGAQVSQGDVLGAVGQEDATYPHLHFEFRKGTPRQGNSVHPLRYLPYLDTGNVGQLRLDRTNFYLADGLRRAVRLGFTVADRREGDLQAVHVTVKACGVAIRELDVDFDDRSTVASDKGDEHAFNSGGIAVEGYQKSNLKGDGLPDLHYGVIVRDIAPADAVEIQVLGAGGGPPAAAEFALPEPGGGRAPVDSREGFAEGDPFPPPGWERRVLPVEGSRFRGQSYDAARSSFLSNSSSNSTGVR
jgi:hypothetical protein